ncbi:amidase [Nocardioides sp. GY 10127]|uniref:amidase n=1 Tax=Nocardioides sp. GY 10127 TaxID=2569762 RepID=UPI0010A8EE14|nr:amidase [Nocardioides sp. GY 10127]TIC81677.1 amidase [Nocardioides sp. GY 10127]
MNGSGVGTGTPLPVPPGLVDAFWAYERALMSNDLEALDRLFAPGEATLRGDAEGLLVGHDQIGAFRSGRGGAPQRRIVQTHVQVTDSHHALVVAVTELARGGRGQQTQLWALTPDGWKVTAAHVSVPAPALDTRTWRVVGDPLVPGSRAGGPLAGETVAVKDLYAVAGQVVGAGNPAWESAAAVERRDAEAVERLVEAGAALKGITRTDEFAYSLAGTNHHYGTPPNPRAPRRVPGGSSSGSATAVALGQATIGLGTDTGGSIRVPSSYQGLAGIRTSHGAVSVRGLLPLAPSFDTVGWMTRDAGLLRRVGEVLLPQDTATGSTELVVVPGLLNLADPDVRAAIEGWLSDVGLVVREGWPLGQLGAWLRAFQTWQGWEAWGVHGHWLAERMDTLGPDVRGRFENAAAITKASADAAYDTVQEARGRIRDLVGERILVLPSSSSTAPRPGAGLQAVRDATMRLTCVAGIGGLPAVSLPLTTRSGTPCGVCLVAAPGRDRQLLELAESLSD